VKTAKFGLTLGFAAFLLPFLFVYYPSLLLIGSPLAVIMGVARATLALTLLSAGSIGFLNSVLGVSNRVALVLAGLLVLMPDLWGNVFGILIALCVLHLSRRKESSISLTVVQQKAIGEEAVRNKTEPL